ncbi:MAG: DUF2970 domain-containing protein [Chromatiales bacterium]|nr:DUF2970 domain-containing protein [Chromatiales bacterium]
MSKAPESPPTLLQVFASVVSAWFGVQSDEKRRRDFERGRAGQFIVVGIVFTVAFIALIVGLVWVALRIAT